jgi:hypothetical protein
MPRKTATHVAIPPRSRGRPPKNRTPVAHPPPLVTYTPIVKSTPVPIPNAPTTSLGKRKPSLGSQPYSAPTSSLKKSLRETKKQKISPVKSVGFVDSLDEDSSDANYEAETVKKTRKASKAAKAGELVKKRAELKERVAEIGIGKGVTRSGRGYTVD